MLKWIGLSIMLFFGIETALGQNTGNLGLQEEAPLYVEGFDYPSFDPISNYAWFKVHFPFGPTTEINLGGEHFRSFAGDRFNTSIELKQYFARKAYLFSGYQMEWDLMNNNEGKPNPKPRQELFYGLGYDVKPNLLMEAKLVSPLGNPQFSKFGLEGVSTRLEIGTRFKF